VGARRDPLVADALARSPGALAPGARPAPPGRLAGGIASPSWPHQPW